MVAIYHPIIQFRNKTNYDSRFVVATFSPDQGEVETYLDMEPIFTDSHDGTNRIDYGARFASVAQPIVTLIEADGSDITPNRVRQALRWLTGSREVSWLDVCNEDGSIFCSYLGRFTNVKLHKIDARVIGIIAEFTANSPWAYSELKTVKFTIGEGLSDFKIDNNSDDLYTYIHPNVTFENSTSGESLTLINNTVGSETKFTNLLQNEIITIDSNLVVYSDNDARIFNNNFNFEFPSLVPGTNDFEAIGNGELTIKFRYPMKVFDSMPTLQGSAQCIVEDAILKITGDTTLNPPVGINIQVVGNKIVIRGNLKSVQIPPKTNVENGNLIIEEAESVCPFDETNVKVVDGALIISKDLNRVSL